MYLSLSILKDILLCCEQYGLLIVGEGAHSIQILEIRNPKSSETLQGGKDEGGKSSDAG